MTEEKKDFILKDQPSASPESPSQQQQDRAAADFEAQSASDSGRSASSSGPLPEINFATFVFSLNTSVLVHLGVLEDPGSGEKTKNLPFAKQTIDILAMLEQKTRGNLESNEETMLKNILYDLRMLYVKESR